MLVDIHSHILWGLDDGAQTPEETLSLAKLAVEQGITHLIATPHYRIHQYEATGSQVLERVQEANHLLQSAGVPITILPGMEIQLYERLLRDFLSSNQLMSLNDTKRYILLELPYDHIPHDLHTFLFEIQIEGIIPILSHVERSHALRNRPEMLYQLIARGALTQVTAQSVIGKKGNQLKKYTYDLMKHNMVHLIASDAHHINHRPFMLKEAYEHIHKRFGFQEMLYYQRNAELVLDGAPIFTPPVKRRSTILKLKNLFK